MTAKLCPHCKAPLNEGATVCATCGRDVVPKKKPPSLLGIGCLAIVILIFVVTCSALTSTQPTSTSSQPARHSGNGPPQTDWCKLASQKENSASSAINNDSYQTSYDAAVAGLKDNESCDDEDSNLVNHAFLLSMKALAEHHLSSGDSRTDLNEANALLETCITKPGLYGTHTGASCQTQQQYNIQNQTNWDMGQ